MVVSISKKFGQFRQWTGEKFGTTDKTDVSEDFRRLDIETESRRDGVEKLTIGVTDYAKTLDKRSSQDKKQSVLALLAKAMTQQGNFHGEQAKLGVALKKISEAEDKLGCLQEEFAEKVRKGLLLDLMALSTSMKDYTALKKKLEMRRLDYDAKLNKLNKTKKEKPGLEEEMQTAQKKYNETLTNVEELMSTFAQREELLLAPLIEFAEAQSRFFMDASESLKSLQSSLTNQHLEQSITDNSSTPDKADILRRKSSITTVLPASIATSAESIAEKRQNTSPSLQMLKAAEAPVAISNISREASLRKSSTKITATIDEEEACVETPLMVKAQYDFSAEMSGEMSIKKGDVIKVIKKVDEGWWQGECNGQAGLFPANYANPITEKITNRDDEQPPRTSTNSTPPKMSRERLTASTVQSSCKDCGCSDFTANVFKPKQCNNCFHHH